MKTEEFAAGSIEAKVQQLFIDLLIEVLGGQVSPMTASTLFIDELAMDSLDKVNFLISLEDEFDQEILDEDVPTDRTLGACVTALVTHYGDAVKRRFPSV